jgi:hypothetical protein
MKKNSILIFFLAIAVLIISSVPCPALVALPQDAGINYKTMTMTDASKLKARGMEKVNSGDAVTIRVAEDKALWIINNRTGEKIKWTVPR